jgi:hypothetical protein
MLSAEKTKKNPSVCARSRTMFSGALQSFRSEEYDVCARVHRCSVTTQAAAPVPAAGETAMGLSAWRRRARSSAHRCNVDDDKALHARRVAERSVHRHLAACAHMRVHRFSERRVKTRASAVAQGIDRRFPHTGRAMARCSHTWRRGSSSSGRARARTETVSHHARRCDVLAVEEANEFVRHSLRAHVGACWIRHGGIRASDVAALSTHAAPPLRCQLTSKVGLFMCGLRPWLGRSRRWNVCSAFSCARQRKSARSHNASVSEREQSAEFCPAEASSGAASPGWCCRHLSSWTMSPAGRA